jgi:hypothetical protein
LCFAKITSRALLAQNKSTNKLATHPSTYHLSGPDEKERKETSKGRGRKESKGENSGRKEHDRKEGKREASKE